MRSGASGVAWRCMSRRVFCRFCHAHSRVPIEFGPFHYFAFCERAAPDAPEPIDDQRHCTGCRDRTNLGRLARERIPTAPATWLGPITPTVYPNASTLTEDNGRCLFDIIDDLALT